MKAGGGAGRREEAALWLWLLLIATACSFAFLLLNLPGGERTGRPQLSMKEIGEIARLDALPEEIEGQADEIAAEEDERISRSSPSTKEKIWMMQDQLIMARAYLQFASPHGNTHLVRELKLRMKEIERAISHSSSGSRVPGSTLQKMKAMELTLSKAQRAYPHCSHMAPKLRAMTYNSEELVRAHRSESSFLEQVPVRTSPKGHHCLALRLTSEYFSLYPKEREFPKRSSMVMDDFHHYAIFSDNILASAVVINSTIAASKDPKRIMFHVITDALSFPAMMMWFLTKPPSPATIQIESMDELKWLPVDFSSRFKQKGIRDPRYTSALNHLRFYLPEVFPSLSNVLLLDHDVVVQKDLSGLWQVDMKSKVNGALETCSSGNGYHRLDNLVNFSDPSIINKFDAKACIYAFGMNIFDLKEWRNKGLTAAYDKWFQAGKRRRVWKAGSLPLGQLVFYNQTVPLDHRWHVLGLGQNSNTGREEIERAAVIHYSGNLKPWLEISIPKYKEYWNRFLGYDNTYLQQCNIHK
ncbi:probable galacturonosyltransferase 6 isoform X1 [Triticum dicoccoides]|uniref:probable galacturonosyltransferase 6 isoform X1 n=1 Tax=Triticum dicoccoides TaxID=85692 RepID=UPI0018904166|nr:probable galacturonosyltransferase 6 isoform X1 [Triticum dicoccoides]XP_037430198.1 probable galacturonosyltransferase 6 isoform X1 [Triticum dicoccoides]